MQIKKDIFVLGIHDGHNAGAVLLKNGSIVAGINEERLTNVKNQAGAPALSIQKVIDIAGITPSDISLVAVASQIRVVSDPVVGNNTALFKLHSKAAPYFHSKAYIRLSVELLKRLRPRTDLVEALKIIGVSTASVRYIDHHTSHTATAYYRKPWKDKTLIFTLDGMGDGISATVSVGEGNTIMRIAQTSFFDSPSDNIYSEITEYLGMKRAEHEYKVMGLAPYGNYEETIDVFRNLIRLNPHNTLEFENRTRHYLSGFQPLYRKYFAKKRFDNIAAGVQKHFEQLVTSWVAEGIKLTHIHKVVAGGGSFLNVKTNLLLRLQDDVEDFFVYPASDDSGLAEGAAIAAYVQYCKDRHISFVIHPLKDLYYGQEFLPHQIKEYVKKKNFSIQNRVDPNHIAKLLESGSIIARFSGRDEWGPRALGNRSIMADPRNMAVVTRLNRAIKQRDFWMPFAPAILKEDQEKYVKHNHFSPYMIEAFHTKEGCVDDIIAATHPADKTTRPMTVNDWNPGWQQIIREFKKLTGVGAILNTSFNLHGYPLVGTPENALNTFDNSDLDGLILGDLYISKKR